MIKFFFEGYIILLIAFFSCNSNTTSTNKIGIVDTSISNNLVKPSETTKINVDTIKSGDNIGIGVLVLKEQDSSKIKIYNLDTSVWEVLLFPTSNMPLEISPFALNPDNYLLILKVNKKVGSFYEVTINEQNKSKKLIESNNNNFLYQTWQKHLLTVFSIGFDTISNPLRTNPITNSKIEQFDNQEFYHPIKISGDWIQVKGINNHKKGWVKWVENNHLIITPFYDA